MSSHNLSDQELLTPIVATKEGEAVAVAEAMGSFQEQERIWSDNSLDFFRAVQKKIIAGYRVTDKIDAFNVNGIIKSVYLTKPKSVLETERNKFVDQVRADYRADIERRETERTSQLRIRAAELGKLKAERDIQDQILAAAC